MPQVILNDYKHLPVGGRLAKFHKQWGTSTFWRIIRYGLTWKWRLSPLSMRTKKGFHQPTSSDLDKAILKMLRKRVIEKTRFLKFRSLLFSVPKKNSTETRTILDLSELNNFILITTFKMITLKEVRMLLPLGAWTVSLDLKDGFHHLLISRRFRPYLGFCYRGQNWRFRAMPFGLNIAPKIFTKLIAFAVLCLSREGV